MTNEYEKKKRKRKMFLGLKFTEKKFEVFPKKKAPFPRFKPEIILNIIGEQKKKKKPP